MKFCAKFTCGHARRSTTTNRQGRCRICLVALGRHMQRHSPAGVKHRQTFPCGHLRSQNETKERSPRCLICKRAQRLAAKQTYKCGCAVTPENTQEYYVKDRTYRRCRACDIRRPSKANQEDRMRRDNPIPRPSATDAYRLRYQDSKYTAPTLAPREPLDLSADPDVIRYREERARAAERHAPAKAELQRRIEAAWQAKREEDLAAQKGGRPRTKNKIAVGRGL